MLYLDTAVDLASLRNSLKALPLQKILWALAILLVGILVVRVILKIVSRLMKKTHLDSGLHRFIRSILAFVLYFCVLLIVVGYLGLDVTSLVALLSVVSLAITLSVQNVLSNVAGGVLIIGNKPFKQGDFVALEGLEGTVDEIGMFYTRLHTIDNRSVLMPNSKVAAATIENFSSLGKRRLEALVSASYESDPEKVMAALHKAVDRCEPLQGEPVIVEFHNFGESAIEYQVCLWVPAAKFVQRRYDLRRFIWEEFRKGGVEMTYPHLNLHIRNEK